MIPGLRLKDPESNELSLRTLYLCALGLDMDGSILSAVSFVRGGPPISDA